MQGVARLRLEPASLTLLSGETALVEVVVADIPISGLAAFQFDVRFDATRLAVTNPNEAFRAAGIAPFAPLGNNPFCTAVRGTATCSDPTWFLTSTGRAPLGTDLIDNEHGVVQVAYGTFGSSAPPTGGGTIALIVVTANTAAPAILSLSSVILADASEPPTRFPVRVEGATINGAIGDPGDANCDDTVSAADLTSLLMLLPTALPSTCGGGDANQDGSVDEDDLVAVIDAVFPP
jgi:hypothetical protein